MQFTVCVWHCVNVTLLYLLPGFAIPSSSLPDSVASEKSFGSTGSGGAVVGSRRNSTSSTKGSGKCFRE